MNSTFAVDLEKISHTANVAIVVLCGLFGLAGFFVSFYFHFLTVAFFLLVLLNLFWRHGQTSHTLLANFGFLAQIRYLVESIGPEFRTLVREMKRQDTVPDFVTVDGGEGGTGAAPKSFLDDLGLPLFEALPIVHRILQEEGVRDRLVIFASGKLISPGKQLKALSLCSCSLPPPRSSSESQVPSRSLWAWIWNPPAAM